MIQPNQNQHRNLSSKSNAEAHSKAWRLLCTAHGMRCFADRSWKFFLPLFLSKSCGMRPTVAISLAQNLAVATLSTAAAAFYRSNERSFLRATLLENAAVVLCGAFLSLFAVQSQENTNLCNAPFQSPVFMMAVICGCIDAVCSSLLSTIISKEWVATLFLKKEMPVGSLAQGNARLSQIDLIAATICPIFVSFVIKRGGGYIAVLILLVCQHAFGAFVILSSVERAQKLRPDLGHIAESTQDKTEVQKTKHLLNPLTIFVDTAVSSKVKLVTAAYVLLYCTVLSPGAVLNAWLNSVRQHHPDLNEETIAWFGSSSNLIGAFATILTPVLVASMGKYRAGAVAQFFQCTCVILATFCFHRLENDHDLLVKGFLIPVAISRVGLWGFDLIERQVLQENVPRDRQTIFFNSEGSLTQAISLVMMYLCYIFSDPSSFGTLVNLSASCVSVASVILGLSLLI